VLWRRFLARYDEYLDAMRNARNALPKTRMPASLWAHEHGQVLRHGTHAMQQVPAFRQR